MLHFIHCPACGKKLKNNTCFSCHKDYSSYPFALGMGMTSLYFMVLFGPLLAVLSLFLFLGPMKGTLGPQILFGLLLLSLVVFAIGYKVLHGGMPAK